MIRPAITVGYSGSTSGSPRYRATLYCSYHPLRGNLDRLLDESRELVYRQSIRPEAVQAGTYENDSLHIYATLYDLSAESATPLQFIATDSVRYLLRGSVYFDERVKATPSRPSSDTSPTTSPTSSKA